MLPITRLRKMAGEEITLPVELEKLEIQSNKHNTTLTDENPFHKRHNIVSRPSQIWSKRCSCVPVKRTIRKTAVYKRTNNKLLKEPVLKFFSTCCHYDLQCERLTPKPGVIVSTSASSDSKSFEADSGSPDFCSLIDNKLQISNESEDQRAFASESFQVIQSPDVFSDCLSSSSSFLSGSSIAHSSSSDRGRGSGPSCSQQALNPPCDVTIDELASYFETLVHIPKKMSTMAEMMYI